VSRLVLRQTLRYDYPAPIRRLRHHLMVLPPARHGDQRRVSSSVDVKGPMAQVVESVDRFGNVALEVHAARVRAWIEFVVEVTVEREGDHGRFPTVDDDSRLLASTPLTEPDRALAGVATELLRSGDTGWALADRVNAWVAATMRYRHDITTVSTTAAEALALGQGVCQDYAHVMLALCRLCGLPARYVSGHLMGEGGSHAWVEVVLPSPVDGGAPVAVPFDPTNNRRAGDTYLTVAVGRDYADVAPTHGTYSGGPGGGLTSSKSLAQEKDAVELVLA
jgi:transglutaminase-like putative cysteine protease